MSTKKISTTIWICSLLAATVALYRKNSAKPTSNIYSNDGVVEPGRHTVTNIHTDAIYNHDGVLERAKQ